VGNDIGKGKRWEIALRKGNDGNDIGKENDIEKEKEKISNEILGETENIGKGKCKIRKIVSVCS
jgi:hypothetical protein